MRGVGVAMAVLLTVGAAPVVGAALREPAVPAPTAPASVSTLRAVPAAPAPAVSRAGAAVVNLAGTRVTTKDRGPDAAVAAVRAQLPGLLTRDGAADRIGAHRHPATRALLIEQVWAPSQVARRAARTPVERYGDNTFVVTRWQGVVVSGNRATATVRGHQRLRSGGLTWDLPDRQLWVELAREGGRWLLVLVGPTDGSDAGCCAEDRVDPGADPVTSSSGERILAMG